MCFVKAHRDERAFLTTEKRLSEIATVLVIQCSNYKVLVKKELGFKS